MHASIIAHGHMVHTCGAVYGKFLPLKHFVSQFLW